MNSLLKFLGRVLDAGDILLSLTCFESTVPISELSWGSFKLVFPVLSKQDPTGLFQNRPTMKLVPAAKHLNARNIILNPRVRQLDTVECYAVSGSLFRSIIRNLEIVQYKTDLDNVLNNRNSAFLLF